MASNMPLQNSTLSLAHTLFSTFQTDRITLIDSERIYPGSLVEEVKHLVLSGYAGFQNAVNYIIPTAPEQGLVALEEPVMSQDRTSSAQYVSTSRQEAEAMLEQRPHNRNNSESFLSGADDLEEALQHASHEDHSSTTVAIARSKRAWMWMTILIVGVLSLVVVPGLLVGIITGQIPWGIALAGAIATIVSFFAGLYYHYNK